MKEFVQTFCALSIVCAFGVAVGYGLDKRPIAPQEKILTDVPTGSIVRILIPSRNSYCTGTVIGPRTVLTALHCLVTGPNMITTADAVEITSADRSIVALAESINAEPQFDRAIIFGDFSAFAVAPIYTDLQQEIAAATPTSVFQVCGYALDDKLLCEQMPFDRKYLFSWQVSGGVLPGMSGGPAFLNGKLIAVIYGSTENRTVLFPVYVLKNVLGN